MKKFARLTFIVLWLMVLTACTAPTQIPPTTAPTAVPTQTMTPARELIRPGDKIGEMTIDREESKHYYWIFDSCDLNWSTTPHSQTMECTVPELAVVGVGEFWGAEKSKLESNWKEMSWELYIDDYPIALDEFGWSDISYFDPGAGFDVTFRHWNVILRNLSAGRHTIRSSWSQEITINDGWDDYPPGKYEFIANLTVTEKPDYPTLPSAAEPGQHTYTSAKANLDFLLYVPESYGKDPEQKWPLLVYLHDAELRGTTPDFLRKESLPKRLNSLKDFPFLVISPLGNGGWDFWSKEEMIVPVMSVLDEVQSTYAVDENRVYLTGAGMGGNGVWTMGLLYPEYFAALAPLGGYIYPFEIPENICALKDVPVWALHGENDFMVPAEVEQNLVDALNACGGNAKITVNPNAVIPVDEYFKPQLYDWLLLQTRK